MDAWRSDVPRWKGKERKRKKGLKMRACAWREIGISINIKWSAAHGETRREPGQARQAAAAGAGVDKVVLSGVLSGVRLAQPHTQTGTVWHKRANPGLGGLATFGEGSSALARVSRSDDHQFSMYVR